MSASSIGAPWSGATFTHGDSTVADTADDAVVNASDALDPSNAESSDVDVPEAGHMCVHSWLTHPWSYAALNPMSRATTTTLATWQPTS